MAKRRSVWNLLLGAPGREIYTRSRDAADRGILQDTLAEARGFAPDPFGQNIMGDQGDGLSVNNPLGIQEGTGLLADPSNLANQLTYAEAALGQVGGEALGQGIIADALGDERANKFTAGQNKEVRDALAFSREQDRLSREGIAAAQLQQQLMTGAEIPVETPQGIAIVPQINSPRWEEAKVKQQASERLVGVLDSMMQTMDSFGTESWGQKSGLLGAQHTEALFAFKDIFETGVLSTDEIDLINKFIEDPTTIEGLWTGNKRVIGQFENAMSLVQSRLADQNALTQYYPGFEPSRFATATPEQLARSADRQAAAATLPPGATLDDTAADRPGGQGGQPTAPLLGAQNDPLTGFNSGLPGQQQNLLRF